VAVHVRELARRDSREAERLLREAEVRARLEGLSPLEGRAVLEARLATCDKAEALQALMRRVGAASCAYAGDDLTDLPAIRFARRHGVGIFARSAERPAPDDLVDAALDGPSEVAILLAELARVLEGVGDRARR
jgi:trehalose-6-phosphatase